MSSFEDRYYLENPTVMARAKRNARLLFSLLFAAFAWLIKGYLLRRELRKASSEGRALQLEDWTDR
ncbi:MAG: hypothetical protein AAF542_01325 [Pseudomonadota bacterium]